MIDNCIFTINVSLKSTYYIDPIVNVLVCIICISYKYIISHKTKIINIFKIKNLLSFYFIKCNMTL